VTFENLHELFTQFSTDVITWATRPDVYEQAGLALFAFVIAYTISAFIRFRVPLFRNKPAEGYFFTLRHVVYQSRDLLFPLILVISLFIATEISDVMIKHSWLVRIGEGIAIILLIFSLISRAVNNLFIQVLLKYVAIPVAILQIFGWLDNVVAYLESLYIEIGNIKITAYGIVRVFIFGAILFWLGRLSNQFGQRVIRQQEKLDPGTREVFSKLYQVALFVAIFILLLQIMGINITALAVFGGALGVGLGFGLQSIASNFISGVILLLDRSLAVGDYIELADGRKGTIRELNMRSTLLETYDGKDIMVPNEQFITTSFTNWTHKNAKQRYSIELQVAYDTDLHKLFQILKDVVSSHPKVISGDDVPIEERPDAEIAKFGESGINILIEFWMQGIDDGENRVGGDLLFMIWEALKANHIQIPFPQREVRIVTVGENSTA